MRLIYKALLVMTIFFVLGVLTGCAQNQTNTTDNDSEYTGSPITNTSGVGEIEDNTIKDNTTYTPQTVEFNMTAEQFDFDPSVIRVRKGDRVIIHLTSTDVDHGIGIQEFGVNVQVPANETRDITFVANQTGEFTFYCNVFCGDGHREMTGKLEVN